MPKNQNSIDPADYTTPWDGSPMFETEPFLYGSSQRRTFECIPCSSPYGSMLVMPSDLAEHHAGHVKRYAEWQAEQAAEAQA
jgi:hypothetical protein